MSDSMLLPKAERMLRLFCRKIHERLLLRRPACRLLLASPVFDPRYYLAAYPDVRQHGTPPLYHYVTTGATERRDPSALFDTAFYLAQLPPERQPANPLLHYLKEGAAQGLSPHPLFDPAYYRGQLPPENQPADPLTHYLEQGAQEGLSPHPLFDPAYYLDENPDVAACGENPLVHYLTRGAGEGKSPTPLFDVDFYAGLYPDVAANSANPLEHYLVRGYWEGRNPNAFFDSRYYLETYPEVHQQNWNPLLHYVLFGAAQGKDPSPFFSTGFYTADNPDVAGTGMNPLAHYLRFGRKEGRKPCDFMGDLEYRPMVSILVPVYNTPEKYLRHAIVSAIHQIYDNIELCLVDDGSSEPHVRPILEEFSRRDSRVKLAFLPENQGIVAATNRAVDMAEGAFLAFLDHDDVLPGDAVLEMVRRINRERQADFLYSDEGFISPDNEPVMAHYKPDFSPDLLLSHNYITHFLLVKKELFHKVGGLSARYEGAQDYDLVLRLSEQAEKIVHIPKVLYLWRTIATSTSIDPEAKSYADLAGKKALEDALGRRGIAGEVLWGNKRFYYRVRRFLADTSRVSIIIPFRDHPELLYQCITAVLERTSYQNYEIVGMDNGSSDEKILKLMQRLAAMDPRVTFHRFDEPFNYSRINNRAVELATGEHLLLMNNDIEVLRHDWLETLLEHSARPEVGAVGARLLYRDNTVQHGGVIIGIAGFAGHSHRHFPRWSPGYYNRLMVIQNMSAVTGALLMVKKSLYLAVGGLDETNLQVALNDVDFCLKLREKGYLNVYTPYCEAYHYESVSRGYEISEEKKARFDREAAFFKEKWHEVLAAGDPYYNSNLTLDREDFSVKKDMFWYRHQEIRTLEQVGGA